MGYCKSDSATGLVEMMEGDYKCKMCEYECEDFTEYQQHIQLHVKHPEYIIIDPAAVLTNDDQLSWLNSANRCFAENLFHRAYTLSKRSSGAQECP